MATVWDNKNHYSGEQFIVNNRASKSVKTAFSNIKNPFTKISKEEYDKSKSKNIIDLLNKSPRSTGSTGNIEFYFKTFNSKFYKVIASCKLSNGFFTWVTKGTSTNRVKMTEIKELASLYMVLSKINSKKFLKEDDLKALVKKDVPDVDDYWRRVYFTSAIEHAKLVKNLNISGRYAGERQGKNITKELYTLAKKITKKAPDNWDPSDIWLIQISSTTEIKNKIKDIKDDKKISDSEKAKFLKETLDILLYSGKLIGISLKQVDKSPGKFSVVSYENVKKLSSSMNFNITSIILRKPKRGLPAYGELKSDSGFNIKWGGKANGQKANINLEGQMNGSTHQLGAIDAKVINRLSKEKKIKIYKDSDFPINDRKNLLIKLKDSIPYDKNLKNLTPEEILNTYGFIEVKRYIANVSVFKFISSLSKEEIMYLYLLAKKIDKINPDYYIFS